MVSLDLYGLQVAASLDEEGAAASFVVEEQNVVMRLDNVGQNNKVLALSRRPKFVALQQSSDSEMHRLSGHDCVFVVCRIVCFHPRNIPVMIIIEWLRARTT